MTGKRTLGLLALLLATLVSASYADTVVIGNFEGAPDGWRAGTGFTLTPGTTGATAGTQALQVSGTGGWHMDALLDAKPNRAALGNKGVKITADVTAFAADMTTTWMQVGMVINCENDNNNGANNNLGWNDLGSQDLARDGQPHTLTWTLPDALTGKIAAADDKIAWFELVLISNLDAASATKFYVDNIKIAGLPLAAPADKATDFIIGNFEQSMDGWTVQGGADVRYNEVNGVTLGKYSLDVFVPTGAWATVLQMDLMDPNNAAALAAFKANTKLTVDVTHLVADWPADQRPGWNETVFVINTDAGYTIVGKQANWNRTNGDRTDHVTYDYSQNLAQMDFSKVTYLQLMFVVNANDAAYTGWVLFYLDNMKLTGGGIAMNPKPANAAADVDVNTKLSWSAGAYAAKHNVYLGKSRGAVTSANGASDPTVTFAPVDGTSFDPQGLAFNTEYFWRVDAVNDVNPDSPWTGATWSFRTANAIIVDNFESYTDQEGQAVFETWIDGTMDKRTGSTVGLLAPVNGTFCNTTTVHGGRQSMPFSYDNTAFKTSEAVRTWATPQDWTLGGYNTVNIYVQGMSSNSVDPLYIIVKDSAGKTATKTCTIATILTTEDWTEWQFPTSDLAGIDVTKVTEMTIGVGNPQGAASKAIGSLLIDDIQIGVKAMGLVAYYKLEGSLLDSSGNGHDGVFGGDVANAAKYVAGPTGFGQAMLFSGKAGGQTVELGTFNPSIATGKLTVALWAKWNGLSGEWQGLIGKRDDWSPDEMMWDIEINRDTGTLQFRRNGSDGVPITAPAVEVGVWTHYAATFDGTTAKFYINGVATDNGRAFTFGNDREALVVFGANNPNGVNPFNGTLDEVRIYDTALSATEVKALLTPQ